MPGNDIDSIGTSLIVTVRNDRAGLETLVQALGQQTELPDEVIVVDGGSVDGTLGALEGWNNDVPLRVVLAPGANIAAGRNAAVDSASGEWIVCTDAGCRPVAGWFGALKHAYLHGDIAAGVFAVEGDSPFERTLAVTHYPVIEELHERSLLVRLCHVLFGRDFRATHAGGRSMAFRRTVWDEVGGFPEMVYAGEDLAFSATAVEKGFRAVLIEDALVRWRPRTSWGENARMFRTYARGDIRTKGRGRHLARVTSWLVAPVLIARGGLSVRLGVLTGLVAYVWLPLRRARRSRLSWREWWRIPALVALKDLSQIAGSIQGVVDELRGVPQPTPHPPPP